MPPSDGGAAGAGESGPGLVSDGSKGCELDQIAWRRGDPSAACPTPSEDAGAGAFGGALDAGSGSGFQLNCLLGLPAGKRAAAAGKGCSSRIAVAAGAAAAACCPAAAAATAAACCPAAACCAATHSAVLATNAACCAASRSAALAFAAVSARSWAMGPTGHPSFSCGLLQTRCRQACFDLLDPPNLGLSRQFLHPPQSPRTQSVQLPHRTERAFLLRTLPAPSVAAAASSASSSSSSNAKSPSRVSSRVATASRFSATSALKSSAGASASCSASCSAAAAGCSLKRAVVACPGTRRERWLNASCCLLNSSPSTGKPPPSGQLAGAA